MATAFSVPSVAATFAVVVAFTMAAAFAVIMMPMASAMAVAALMGEELPVQAFGQLFLSGVAHGYHLAGEVQCLAGHGGVEVHGHLLVLDLHDHAVADFSRRIEHGDELPGLQQVLAEFAVDLERTLRYVEDLGQVVFAICFLRRDGAVEGILMPWM